jgi:hypothetical protein
VVASAIIAATALSGGQKGIPIYQVGSSDLNPYTWAEMKVGVINFWNSTVSESKMSKAKLIMTNVKSRFYFENLKRRLPLEVYSRLSPFLGKQHVKTAHRMVKTFQRGEEVSKIFEFFMTHDWIYESKNVTRLCNSLSSEDRKAFFLDIAEIDFKKYVDIVNYGIQKNLLKEHAEHPLEPKTNLLTNHTDDHYFSDLSWAVKTHMPVRPIHEIKTKILSSTRVLKAIDFEAQRRMEGQSLSLEKATLAVRVEAEKVINDLVAEVKVPVMRSMAYTLHKAFKSIFEKITINMDLLEEIKQLEKNS